MKTHRHSVSVDLRAIKGKDLKVVADTIRSGIIQEHGFSALKGVTDKRLRDWPTAIRFKTASNRAEFYDRIRRILHPRIISKIGLKFTTPRNALSEPVRKLRAS